KRPRNWGNKPGRQRFASGPRPADTLLVGAGKDGKSVCVDVARTHPHQPKHITKSSAEGGAAADIYAETVKARSSNAKLAEKHGYIFEPLVVDTFGAWSLGAIRVIRQVANRYATRMRMPESKAIEVVFGNLSMALVQAQAAAVAKGLDEMAAQCADRGRRRAPEDRGDRDFEAMLLDGAGCDEREPQADEGKGGHAAAEEDAETDHQAPLNGTAGETEAAGNRAEEDAEGQQKGRADSVASSKPTTQELDTDSWGWGSDGELGSEESCGEAAEEDGGEAAGGAEGGAGTEVE
ncbi:MAG: hypothetical protein FD161_5007, partial [Limisphaerales bacterium]